jgi:hypothetical protein
MKIELLTPEECAAVRQVIEPAPCNQVQYIGDMLLKELTAETQMKNKDERNNK